MTVGETMEFAGEFTNSRFYGEFEKSVLGQRLNLPGRKCAPIVEFMLQKFGLMHVKNTYIGNELMRGVSGGERKRCTVAEMKVAQTIFQEK